MIGNQCDSMRIEQDALERHTAGIIEPVHDIDTVGECTIRDKMKLLWRADV
jgi:hypothetical protein